MGGPLFAEEGVASATTASVDPLLVSLLLAIPLAGFAITALAAKKAFITNRVGDVGFALGIMAIWTTVGTLDFQEVFELLPQALAGQPALLTGIALLLFLGAMGKS